MNKKDRQIVFDKFGGKCAYCGCELSKNGNGIRWSIDHIEPIHRKMKLTGGYEETPFGSYVFTPYKKVADGCYKPQLDCIENSNPSCVSCNNYKSTMGLETFRKNVGLLVERLNKSFTQYKIAKRYGLIEETGKEVKFYFETLPSTTN